MLQLQIISWALDQIVKNGLQFSTLSTREKWKMLQLDVIWWDFDQRAKMGHEFYRKEMEKNPGWWALGGWKKDGHKSY